MADAAQPIAPPGRRRRPLARTLEPYLYLAPAGLILLIFWFLPVLLALLVSFFDATALKPIDQLDWVGLRQYWRALHDEDFIRSFWNTVNFTLYSVPPTLALSLLAALLLNSKIKGRAFFRTAFFLPYITTWVAIAIVWSYIFNREAGLANWLLRTLSGDPTAELAWMAEPRGIWEMATGLTVPDLPGGVNGILEGPSLAMLCIIITSVWRDLGYFMVLFLAGLQNIDHSYYEAADIDGATPLQKFWRITFPLLSPITFFNLIVAMITALREFVPMLIMTPTGGPDYSTAPIVYHMYTTGFRGQWELSYASAIAYILTIMIVLMTLAQNKIFGQRVEYGH